MKYAIRKDEEGVSPVIAVILMVAITVVLAAVLYVWAASFLDGTGENAPFGTFQTKVVGDDNAVRVIKLSSSADACSFSWYLKDQMGNTAQFGETCADEGEESECVTFYDNDSDGDLTAGDQYMIDGDCFGDDYSFDVKHDPSGDIIGSANLR
tara:strand:+ start:4540 stop:4998 length:459 start_codon:yes stop_codon:yes gene_type:complete